MDEKIISKSSEFIDSLVKALLEMRGHSEDDSTQYDKTKKELQEVYNKVAALRKAIQLAETLWNS